MNVIELKEEPAELEQFETFARDGSALGLVDRSEVHNRGLWHRSAHVFLFDSAGRLLIQLRAADKDLYPDLWDYSVGEHAKPGEQFVLAAARGLQEELGLSSVPLEPLGEPRWVEQRGHGFIDREIQQAFRGALGGPVVPDPVEVAEVRLIDMAQLQQWIEAQPGDFTPWFVQDVYEFGFLTDHATDS